MRILLLLEHRNEVGVISSHTTNPHNPPSPDPLLTPPSYIKQTNPSNYVNPQYIVLSNSLSRSKFEKFISTSSKFIVGSAPNSTSSATELAFHEATDG